MINLINKTGILKYVAHSFIKFSSSFYSQIRKIESKCFSATAPSPGTCNLFQVTGQIATLQWSPGPDNVEHVNEG